MTNAPEISFDALFDSNPAPLLLLDSTNPGYLILEVNKAFTKAVRQTRKQLIGKSFFSLLSEYAIEITDFDNHFKSVIATKRPLQLKDHPYVILNKKAQEYWNSTNSPIFNDRGEVVQILHAPENVTELHLSLNQVQIATEMLKLQQKKIFSTFMQAPVGIGILKGSNYVVEMINPTLCEVYGLTQEFLTGKPIFDVLTDAKDLGFEVLLDSVMATGKTFKGNEYPVLIKRGGKLETLYFDFVYEPYMEDDGSISGVIVVANEVTEQVLFKNMLEESEARANLVVDSVGLGTFDLNLKNGKMFTSKRFANIFGFDEPVPRSEYIKAFDPADRLVREKALKEAQITGRLMYEVRVIWKDGSEHWVRSEGKVFYDKNNQPVRILGIMLDITDQRRAKIEQQKLVTLVANSADLMSILELTGHNSYINLAGQRLLGFKSPEDALTIPFSDLHAPEDYDFIVNEVIPAVMKTGQWTGIIKVRHLQTGEVFPLYNNCIRIDDPETGKTLAIGAVMRDLRPELNSKRALADSEHLLKQITNAAPTTLWMSDKTGEITYINQTWTDWTGLSVKKSLGFGFLNGIFEADRKISSIKLKHAFDSQKPFEFEFRITFKNGSIRWCSINAQPQFNTDRVFTGFIGACIDITDQKLLQQQKDDFIGIASHELKTPVTSIKAYTQILRRMLTKNGESNEANMVGRMDSQINRLNHLIGDLLDVTKINSGKLIYNNKHFNFDTMVSEMVDDLQRTTEQHQIITDFEAVGDIFGDEERIGQVVSNLITNAIKYSPKATEIRVSTRIKDELVSFCVEDYGIGIDEDKLSKVFDQFYRAVGGSQQSIPGLGLGLFISAEIIKREGGKIWATSDVGKGSIFCFDLPVKRTNNNE